MSNNRHVTIRRNIENFGDPYLAASDDSVRVCSGCEAVYWAHRWYLPDRAKASGVKTEGKPYAKTLCPACQKIRDHVPGGVLTVSGGFAEGHKEEILNLIHNETERAMDVNPLERVMAIEPTKDGFEVTTTNEKLAQRMGRALHKAYDGIVTYRWSTDTKLVRVAWHRG